MAEKDKRYFWLKLDRNFFKRHDIRIIEAMPNGKDYILFYLKLLCESIDHEGNLRFNEQIPYNEDMLSVITNTNVDIVRSAVKIFSQLDMMEVMDDGTYYMHEVEKMIGSESYWAEKKRLQREQEKPLMLDNVQPMSNESPTCPSKSKSKRESKSNSKNKSKKFIPPTLEEVKDYCFERNNQVDAEAFIDFYTSKGWMVGKNPMKDWKACVRTWEKRDSQKADKGNKVANQLEQSYEMMAHWAEEE